MNSSNLMQLILSAARGGGNPMAILQQAAGRDPRAQQAMQMIQGKSPAELQRTVENMCRERGTTPEQVARQMGLF